MYSKLGMTQRLSCLLKTLFSQPFPLGQTVEMDGRLDVHNVRVLSSPGPGQSELLEFLLLKPCKADEIEACSCGKEKLGKTGLMVLPEHPLNARGSLALEINLS